MVKKIVRFECPECGSTYNDKGRAKHCRKLDIKIKKLRNAAKILGIKGKTAKAEEVRSRVEELQEAKARLHRR